VGRNLDSVLSTNRRQVALGDAVLNISRQTAAKTRRFVEKCRLLRERSELSVYESLGCASSALIFAFIGNFYAIRSLLLRSSLRR
jgi:hypothetical protein